MKLMIIRRVVAHLFPGYFAMVMATGVISIASFLLSLQWVARALLWVGLATYVLLWALTILRLIGCTREMCRDLMDHARGPGFFTLVAGTCVLGTDLLVVSGNYAAAIPLWWLGLILWTLIMYAFFTAVTIRERKPSLQAGINGAWLIATVATQSISILAVLISAHMGIQERTVLFLALCMYLLGCMLYLSIITLIFYRFTFVKLTTADFTPPYWINMGAVAITTLSGSTLILHAGQWPVLGELLPFLKGFTLFFWVTATWWIPLLFILLVWRHLYRRFPVIYDPQYWGMVFPLGMYTTGTLRLTQAINLPVLKSIPRYFIYVALVAWAAAFAGLLHHLQRQARALFS